MGATAKVGLTLPNKLFDIFDRCAVNYAAHQVLKGLSPNALPIGCSSHTASHPGEKAVLPLVKALVEALSIATHSIGARTLFKQAYGEAIEGHSQIRWYCSFNQAKQQFRDFVHLTHWVRALEFNGFIKKSVEKLKTVLETPKQLKLELSVMVDAFDLFVRKCISGKVTQLV